MRKSSLFILILTIIFSNTAIAAVDNISFCSFLPRQPGGDIGESESDAIIFCTSENLIQGAKVFPPGFIQSAHFAKTNSYVQVTGRFDRTKYNLSATDGGGQYDNQGNGSPPGASCHGYTKFVNLVEPDIEIYCIRCCQNPDDCNTGDSTEGCKNIIPGDYS